MKNKTLTIVLASLIGGFFLFSFLYNAISPTKRNLKEIRSAMDIENPITRKFSLQLAASYPGKYNIDQVCKIFDYIYKNWKYVNDPRGMEYVSKASLTINNNLTGDCDDFAILLATTIESIGGKTRISYAVNKSGDGHAFTEVYFKEDPKLIYERINYHFQSIFELLFGISRVKKIYYTPGDKNGIWLNLDWNSKYPGGQYFDYRSRVIYYPTENYFTSEN